MSVAFKGKSLPDRNYSAMLLKLDFVKNIIVW